MQRNVSLLSGCVQFWDHGVSSKSKCLMGGNKGSDVCAWQYKKKLWVVGNLELGPHCNIYPTGRLRGEMVTVPKENRKELLPWLTGEYRPLIESASRYRTVHIQTKLVSLGLKIISPG